MLLTCCSSTAFFLQAQQLKFPLQQASQKLINSHYKYRVWWCALFGWSASPTNTGYGGVLWLVDQLVLQIQGMVVCFVWLINLYYRYRVWWCALFG